MGHHHHDHHRPLSSSSKTIGGGPTCNSGANKEVGSRSRSDIYQDAAAANGGAVVRTLQSSDISTTTSNSTGTASRSPGGGGAMAAALGFPFTSAQWKELERQAMIYKYMIAAVPVPPDLLLPITQTLSTTHPATSHSSLGNGSILNLSLRFSNNKDAEPGRCKRTDGKKWRCSRDVAPHQKYCERHVHRGRPRSRKPVEVQPPFNSNSSSNNMINKKTRLIHHHTLPPAPASHTSISSPHQVLGSTIQPNETPLFLDKPDENISANSSYKEHNRGLDWAMEGEIQQWQHLLQTNVGLTTEGSICHTSSPVFQQDCIEEPLNPIPYADFGECSLFLNPDLVCLEKQSQMETPRGFIDAWSNEDPNTNNSNDKNESSVSSQGNFSPSSLTLSMTMAAGNALDEEMGQIQMGIGVRDSNYHKPQVSSWLSPVSWVGSTPGGPLAEVLRPSSITAVSPNPTSPYACNGDSTSTPATRASSPSGVLQRTMLSLSDSSGCASPTINAASTATPEIMPFQWLLR